ncbi:MAG: hypothetical protein K1X88_08045 [Nannocystaceae bacterium]|nr:hypothetical protein [Nannocystaceae bacterium]
MSTPRRRPGDAPSNEEPDPRESAPVGLDARLVWLGQRVAGAQMARAQARLLERLGLAAAPVSPRTGPAR